MTMEGSPRLLERVRNRIRIKHYSIRTEQAYLDWIRRFILLHRKRHPEQMGIKEIEAFLSHLAGKGRVSASTQNQALSAILFLYREVLQMELPWLENVTRAKRPERLPVVLTKEEIQSIIEHLEGTHLLMSSLMYGSGLRLMECVRLRIKDVDFLRHQIVVRSGKGNKDRVTLLADKIIEPLKSQINRVRSLHKLDLAAGYGAVYLPYALDTIYELFRNSWGTKT